MYRWRCLCAMGCVCMLGYMCNTRIPTIPLYISVYASVCVCADTCAHTLVPSSLVLCLSALYVCACVCV